MEAVYLCLTCLKVSAVAGECHERPMIRCGDYGLGIGSHRNANPSTHWLVETVAALQGSKPDEPAE